MQCDVRRRSFLLSISQNCKHITISEPTNPLVTSEYLINSAIVGNSAKGIHLSRPGVVARKRMMELIAHVRERKCLISSSMKTAFGVWRSDLSLAKLRCLSEKA